MRAKLLVHKAVKWVSSCVTHALNSFCEDLEKVKFGTVLQQGLFVSKTLRFQILLHRLFDTICEETIGKRYTMVLYFKMGWFSIDVMVCRLNHTKWALVYLPPSLIYEGERLKIGSRFRNLERAQ